MDIHGAPFILMLRGSAVPKRADVVRNAFWADPLWERFSDGRLGDHQRKQEVERGKSHKHSQLTCRGRFGARNRHA